MTAAPDLDARRDYARSIQERWADAVAAELAKAQGRGGVLAGRHLAALRRRLGQLGIPQSDIEAALAVQEQLHALDEPRVRRQVELYVLELCAAARALGISGLEEVTVSSLPSGEIGAICVADIFDGSSHLLADAELLVFCQGLGKLVATGVADLMRPHAVGLLLPQPPPNAELHRRLADLYAAIIFTGRARASKPWMPEPFAMSGAVALAYGMQLFTVAHELGHVAAGHLKGEEAAAGGLSGPEVRAQELEADAVGLRLIRQAATGSVFHDLRVFAPYVFLKGVELLETGQAVFGTPVASGSHPAVSERLRALRYGLMAAVLPLADKLMVAGALDRLDELFADWCRHLLEYLQHVRGEGFAPVGGRQAWRRMDRPQILGP